MYSEPLRGSRNINLRLMYMSETKSITTDFGGNFNSTNYRKEIEASSIAKTLQYINREGDVVKAVFNTGLSASEKTTLNTVCSNHDANYYPYNDLKHIEKANLCTASKKEGKAIYVTDATTSGGILCFSNGTDWVRCNDLEPV